MKQIILSTHMQIRSEFLFKSLLIESTISNLLGVLLGVNDATKSRSFGNKSSALSFNAKVLLFLDLGVIKNEDYWKFQKFMEIRNQFMHNLDAVSYEECFCFLHGVEEKLLKEYPKIKLKNKEARLRRAALTLASNVSDICIEMATHVTRIKREKAHNIIYKNCTTIIFDLFNELKKKSTNKDTISYKEFMGFYRAKLPDLVKGINFIDAW